MEAFWAIGAILGGVLLFRFAVSLARSRNRKETLGTWTVMPVIFGAWLVLAVIILAVVKWAFGYLF